MKKYILAISAVLAVSQGQAGVHRGTEGVGGGDPHAIEFLGVAEAVHNFLSLSDMLPDVPREEFKSILTEIQSSLDDGKNKPRIVFQDSEVVCAGATKIGCVSENKVVFIHRPEWKKLTYKEKIELVSLEVLQLLNINARYSLAQEIGSFSKEIVSLNRKQKNPGVLCMNIAMDRALLESHQQYPNPMFISPAKVAYLTNEEIHGKLYNRIEVEIQVTTSDDYTEVVSFVYKFPINSCN